MEKTQFFACMVIFVIGASLVTNAEKENVKIENLTSAKEADVETEDAVNRKRVVSNVNKLKYVNKKTFV